MRKRTAKFTVRRSEFSWVPVIVAGCLTLMICLTVNFRAYSGLSRETTQHDELNLQIEQVTSENLALQEEIHYLKTDPDMIRREAQKLGLVPRK